MKNRYLAGLLLAALPACGQPNFVDAVGKESVRGTYLHTLLEHEKAKGREGFELVEEVLYDPDFSAYRQKSGEEMGKYPAGSPAREVFRVISERISTREGKSYHPAATLPPSYQLGMGEPSTVFFSWSAFDPRVIQSEDELLSCFDHEAGHCILYGKGFPGGEGLSQQDLERSSPALQDSCAEALVYRHQLQILDRGLRKTSPRFREMMEASSAEKIAGIKKYEASPGPDGKLARFTLDLLGRMAK